MGQNEPKVTVSAISLDSLGIILFIVFLILKLVGVINWSWLYVTMPLWIPVALDIVIIVITFIICVIIDYAEERKIKKWRQNK